MVKLCATALVGALLTMPIAAAGSAGRRAPEGCEAVNPVQPTCTYKATEAVDTFGGAAGRGDWVVTVKVGKKKTTYKGSATGDPTGTQFMIPAGATVTAKALSAGSGVIVGGE
jgi:hypothetical protein